VTISTLASQRQVPLAVTGDRTTSWVPWQLRDHFYRVIPKTGSRGGEGLSTPPRGFHGSPETISTSASQRQVPLVVTGERTTSWVLQQPRDHFYLGIPETGSLGGDW
jgi:hypothetical protein